MGGRSGANGKVRVTRKEFLKGGKGMHLKKVTSPGRDSQPQAENLTTKMKVEEGRGWDLQHEGSQGR